MAAEADDDDVDADGADDSVDDNEGVFFSLSRVEAALSLPAATLAPPLTLASAAGAAAADAPEAAL